MTTTPTPNPRGWDETASGPTDDPGALKKLCTCGHPKGHHDKYRIGWPCRDCGCRVMTWPNYEETGSAPRICALDREVAISQVREGKGAMTVTDTCANCGREFMGRSRPLWTFARPTADPLGLMHTGCAYARYTWTVDAKIATADEAQFMAWTDTVGRGRPRSARLDAIIMSWAVHPSLVPGKLSSNQQRWIERYPAERQRAIREAYDQLLAEFRMWLKPRQDTPPMAVEA